MSDGIVHRPHELVVGAVEADGHGYLDQVTLHTLRHRGIEIRPVGFQRGSVTVELLVLVERVHAGVDQQPLLLEQAQYIAV